MNDILEQMLSRYSMDTADARRNALYEVMQQVVLSGLFRGGFFSEAAFYGGTCLRIFHGLNRYSEDMDFTLLHKDSNFSLENYFPSIIEECRLLGREVEITKKDKRGFSKRQHRCLQSLVHHREEFEDKDRGRHRTTLAVRHRRTPFAAALLFLHAMCHPPQSVCRQDACTSFQAMET